MIAQPEEPRRSDQGCPHPLGLRQGFLVKAPALGLKHFIDPAEQPRGLGVDTPLGQGQGEDQRTGRRGYRMERRQGHAVMAIDRGPQGLRGGAVLGFGDHPFGDLELGAEMLRAPIEQWLPAFGLTGVEVFGFGGAITQQIGLAIGGDFIDHRFQIGRASCRERV